MIERLVERGLGLAQRGSDFARRVLHREPPEILAATTFEPSDYYLTIRHPGSDSFRHGEVIFRTSGGRRKKNPRVYLRWQNKEFTHTYQYEAVCINYYTEDQAHAERIKQGLEFIHDGRSYFVGPHFNVSGGTDTDGRTWAQLELDEENVGIWLQTSKKRIG